MAFRALNSYLITLLRLLLLVTSLSTAVAAEKSSQPIILVVGDSLSAAYGIPANDGWVQLLQNRVAPQYRVINASISGDTSAGALSRLPGLLKAHHPEILVIEIGGNDGLRGQPIQAMKQNIAKMISLGREYTDKVLLLGIRIPGNYGKRYTNAFFNAYSSLASQQKVTLLPFFMEGVGDQPSLMQNDGIHPNAKAQPILLNNVWNKLQNML